MVLRWLVVTATIDSLPATSDGDTSLEGGWWLRTKDPRHSMIRTSSEEGRREFRMAPTAGARRTPLGRGRTGEAVVKGARLVARRAGRARNAGGRAVRDHAAASR